VPFIIFLNHVVGAHKKREGYMGGGEGCFSTRVGWGGKQKRRTRLESFWVIKGGGGRGRWVENKHNRGLGMYMTYLSEIEMLFVT